MSVLDQLIKSLSRLPGVGNKSATRMAYYLLESERTFVERLSDQIKTLQDRIRHCSICGGYTEADPCHICSDPSRDARLICVVEHSGDILTLEATGEYRGLYHVLGGALNPLDGIGPGELSIDQLLTRVSGAEEVILATNPSIEGDTTALYLGKILKERNIKASRLASGLPVGGDLEYADRLTLARSLRGRTEI